MHLLLISFFFYIYKLHVFKQKVSSLGSVYSLRLVCSVGSTVLDGKSSQEYPVNAGVPPVSILGPTIFLLYIIDLPHDVICSISIYADDTTLCSKCNQASDMWWHLELASELESVLQDTVEGSDLLISMLERLN